MRSRIATCERRPMSISYFTSNDDRLEIYETTSNKIMEDLRDKDKKHLKRKDLLRQCCL